MSPTRKSPGGKGAGAPAEAPAPRPSQLAAMVSLLSDRSPAVVRQVREALRRWPELSRPHLQERLAALRAQGGSRAPRPAPGGPVDGADAFDREELALRRVLADFGADEAEEALRQHLLGTPELQQGAVLLGRLVDGGGGAETVDGTLEELTAAVRARLPDDDDPDAGLAAVRAVFAERQVRGVPPDEARPIDALLHAVTEEGRGLPLPICMAWILVARRAGVPIVGVDMPGHFLVRLAVPERLLLLDPFHGGEPMDLDVCRRFLAAQRLPNVDLLGLDASDAAMLLRSLRNVANLAMGWGEMELANRCRRLLAECAPGGE